MVEGRDGHLGAHGGDQVAEHRLTETGHRFVELLQDFSNVDRCLDDQDDGAPLPLMVGDVDHLMERHVVVECYCNSSSGFQVLIVIGLSLL